MNKILQEDLISFFYPEISLPPLWQVIYHEAMRGNHILFDPNKLNDSDLHSRDKFQLITSDTHEEQTADVIFGILTLNDLNEMRSSLNSLSNSLYQIFYRIYLRLLENLKIYVKSQLN